MLNAWTPMAPRLTSSVAESRGLALQAGAECCRACYGLEGTGPSTTTEVRATCLSR